MNVIDALRLKDNTIVAIKRTKTESQELYINAMLTTPESLSDPTNHAVPVLDYFTDGSDPKITFIVQPLLREFNKPEFYAVSEMIDFMKQTLEVRTSHMSNRAAEYIANCSI